MPARHRKSSTPLNIAEIARLAGVSPATVSRAVNTPQIVADDTLKRVREAIAHTGYVPNLIAGGLASRRTGLIAVVVPSIVGSIFNDTIEAMTDALANAGYQVLLGLSGYGDGGEGDRDFDAMFDAILGRRPDGIIITGLANVPTLRQRLKNTGIPVIETWELNETPIDMAVGFSHARIGVDIAKFVIDRGYRHPFLVSADGPRAAARLAAMQKIFSSTGVPIAQTRLVPMPSTVKHGRDALATFLTADQATDIVICSSDWLALGISIEAQSRGLRIPDDLAVMGFGNLDFASDLNPPLTTVHVDGGEIGRRSAELLVARAKGEKSKPDAIDVGAAIIERSSTKPRSGSRPLSATLRDARA